MQLPHMSLCLQDDQDSESCMICSCLCSGRTCVRHHAHGVCDLGHHCNTQLACRCPSSVLRQCVRSAALQCLQMSQPARLVKKEVEDVRSDQDFSSASQCEGALASCCRPAPAGMYSCPMHGSAAVQPSCKIGAIASCPACSTLCTAC